MSRKQIVYARLSDLVNKQITAPRDSIVLWLEPAELEIEGIAESLLGLKDVLLGVQFTHRDIAHYIYLNEGTKEKAVAELHFVDKLGEAMGKRLYLVSPITHKFPDWDICRQHINGLFKSYNTLFPNVIFTVKNIKEGKLRNNEYVDADADYIVDYFRDIPTVNFMYDFTAAGIVFAQHKSVQVDVNRVMAIIDYSTVHPMEFNETPVMIKGVTFMDMVNADRAKHIPKVNFDVPAGSAADVDAFVETIRQIVGRM